MKEIDTSRLKRNYLKIPISMNSMNRYEKPYKEDLEYLYCEISMSQRELVEYFGVSRDTIMSWIKYYGLKKSRSEIFKVISNTKKERYGDENYNNYKKHKSTCLERYGDENYTNRKKCKMTMTKKYGVESVGESLEFRKKSNETMINLYGAKTPLESSIIRQKIIDNRFKRTGYYSNKQFHISKEIIEILYNKDKLVSFVKNNDDKTIIGLSKKLGIDGITLRNYVSKHDIDDMITYRPQESSYELELFNLYPFLEKHNRGILDGKEIDLYDEKKNIGIEFNGDYWHNEMYKDKLYHQEKSLLAESKGIFLYHIFEYEWNTKKEQILNQLNNLLGINEHKIYARKCIIKEINNNDKTQFLESYHMQGDDKSSVKLGLYYENELVSIMTFCKPRFNKNYEWELSRFCSKSNCNVVGGASKLFKYFIDNYNPKSIISYSNISHTRGNLYKTLGMTLQGISNPNYVWCKNGETLSRYQCQKHKLLEQGFEGNSETEIMHNRGYYRIYDCGNKVWIWKNSLEKT